MKHAVGVPVFALPMSARSPGTTFPLPVPTPLPRMKIAATTLMRLPGVG